MILKETSALTAEERKQFIAQAGPRTGASRSTHPGCGLTTLRLRRLSELSTKDSGIIVGPKAANLGQHSRRSSPDRSPADSRFRLAYSGLTSRAISTPPARRSSSRLSRPSPKPTSCASRVRNRR